MSRKLSEILILLVVAVAAALAPIACSSDNDNGSDGPTDAITGSTHG